MIRVRLLSEPEYAALRKEGRCKRFREHRFYDLLREKGEFTDGESRSLLRHLHGETFVTEKWYSRTAADGKPCLPAISREAMYGLVVIENSRQGTYTPIEEAFSDYEVESRMEEATGGEHMNPLVWQAFARLDMDILLTFRKKDFDFVWKIPIEEEFILENYPIDGVPTEVRVVDAYLRKPELRDGVWCIHNFFYDEKYWWGNDTAEILEYLRQEFMGLQPLVKGIFTVAEFEDMCWPQGNADRFRTVRERDGAEDADAPGIACEAAEEQWRVVNHMEYLPEEGDARRHLCLMIEAYADGRYCLRNCSSVKYPTYEELFQAARELAKPDCEVFFLPLDVNECMGCAKDIRKAVCAFRVVENVIETFGPEEGLREFEKMLRRAVGSGKCEMKQ